MPTPSVLALMVILPLLLIGAALLVCRVYANIPRYGRRKTLPVSTLRRISAKPEWVRQEVIKLKAQGPDLGCRHIAMIFNRRYAANGMTVGKTFVSGVIRKHHYDIQVTRQKLRRRKLTAGPKNRIWGLDLTGKTDDQGQLHSILGILDDGTRADLTLAVVANKSTAILLHVIASCIERFGRPQTPRTDNEAMFRSTIPTLTLAGRNSAPADRAALPLAKWQNRAVLRHIEASTGSLGSREQGSTEYLPAPIPALVQPHSSASEFTRVYTR